MRHAFIAFIVFVCCQNLLSATDWQQQGGPNGNGILPDRKLNMNWTAENAPVRWRANVGFGSSPVVVKNGRVYTFGAYKLDTPPDRLDDPGQVPTGRDLEQYDTTYQQGIEYYPLIGAEGFLPKSEVGSPENLATFLLKTRWRRTWAYVQCFDAGTGKRIWATRVSDHLLLSDNHQQWPRSSPLIVDDGLFIHDSNGQLFRLNAATGEIQWHVDLAEHGMTTFHDKEPNSCGPLYYGGKIILQYNNRGMVVGAFDAKTGEEAWRYTSPYSSFRSHFSRIGFARIDDKDTVLVPAGLATVGLNPADGSVRWELNVYEQSKEFNRRMYEETKAGRLAKGQDFAPSESQITRGYACYTSYAPVAWQDYVVDYRDYAHSDYVSSTYCLKIGADKPQIVWQTNKYVPEAYPAKSNMIARDGKVYFFEFSYHSYINRTHDARLGRPEGVKQFLCLDIPTGELLWSSDAFRKTPSDGKGDEPNGYKFIMAGDKIIAVGVGGLWLGTVSEEGAEARVAIVTSDGGRFGVPNLPAEPVLVGQTLYIRQTMPQAGKGLLGKLGGTGNLFSINLEARDQ